eukprot:Lithocolla_globosa_v1_NODE_2948_length_1814_cov_224.260375.p1 type:complete len:298 gc:universal NODE_2948_length_1814_cov_224.260375:1155-262(-)
MSQVDSKQFPNVTIPTEPTASLLYVTNLDASTTDKVVKEFFSFCGEIKQFEMVAHNEGTQHALLEFQKESAAKTAVLLSNASMSGREINITHYFTDLPAYKHAEQNFADASETLETSPLEQEDKPKTSIVSELLANGYVLSHDIAERATKFDQEHGISQRFQVYLQQVQSLGLAIDEKYQVTNTGKHYMEIIDGKYQVSQHLTDATTTGKQAAADIDAKYHVQEKVDYATATASQIGQQAMETETGQKVMGFLERAKAKALAIHEESKRIAAEKEAQRTAETVMEDTGPVTLPPSSS